MGMHKSIRTALMFGKALASYSPDDRKAIRALITKSKDVRAYQQRIFQQNPPNDSGSFAMLLLHSEGDCPIFSEQSYLVIDKSTGRTYYVYYDGIFVVHNGRQILLTNFNQEQFRWFRIPKIQPEDLIDM